MESRTALRNEVWMRPRERLCRQLSRQSLTATEVPANSRARFERTNGSGAIPDLTRTCLARPFDRVADLQP
jgi:hypothetical protein